MRFKIGRLGINIMYTHRWQKNLNYWDKERWNDFRLGPRVRYYDSPKVSILFGLYLIVAKFCIVFYEN
jgi:hypothetical protein